MTDKSLIDWLSSPENPPVRYLTACHLTRPGPSARALKSLRREIFAWEPLQQLLALQKDDGSFPYTQKTPTAGTTFAALCLMDRCGMDIRDEPVARALSFLRRKHTIEGTFSCTTGGSGVLPCYVGVLCRALISLAGHDDPAVRSSLQWIVDYQRFDHKKTRSGGRKKWPFKAVDNFGGCWWSVSCYHGVATTFRALAAVPAEHRSRTIDQRLKAALRYLKIHRVYKKSQKDVPLFRHMTQFFLAGDYRSHLIDVLEGIAEADPKLIEEGWVKEAVEAVDGLRVDGKIELVKNYAKQLMEPLPFEPTGQPSRFLTYQWVRVKQKFDI